MRGCGLALLKVLLRWASRFCCYRILFVDMDIYIYMCIPRYTYMSSEIVDQSPLEDAEFESESLQSACVWCSDGGRGE